MDALRWDDLRYFLAVAEQGTLAGASEATGLSTATLHRRIAALEEELGGALFHKDPRGYALNALGEALLPRAEAVREAVAGLSRAATGNDGNAQGPVRVAVAADLVPMLVPALSALRQHCPGVVPVLHIANRLVDLGRETDIALRMSPTPPQDAIAHRLGETIWCRYAREDLPTAPWVVYEGRNELGAARHQPRNLVSDAIVGAVDDIGAMVHLLRALPAQGLLPTHVGDAEGLVRLDSPMRDTLTPAWLLVHVDLRRAARVRAFLDVVLPALRQAFAAHPTG